MSRLTPEEHAKINAFLSARGAMRIPEGVHAYRPGQFRAAARGATIPAATYTMLPARRPEVRHG